MGTLVIIVSFSARKWCSKLVSDSRVVPGDRQVEQRLPAISLRDWDGVHPSRKGG